MRHERRLCRIGWSTIMAVALISLKANDAMGEERNAIDCNTSESESSFFDASDSNASDSDVSDCRISFPRAPWGSRPADIRKLHDAFNAQAAAAISANTPASFFFRARSTKTSAAANEAFTAATFRNTPRPPRKLELILCALFTRPSN